MRNGAPFVTLEDGEMLAAQLAGGMRHCVNMACSVGNQRMGDQSDYQINLDGAIAEIAFARFRNVCPDLSVRPRRGGVDVVLADGMTVDVKATRYPQGQLIATLGKAANKGAQIYALAIIEGLRVKFPGWLWAHELLDDKNIGDLGHGGTYAVPQDKLHSWEEYETTNRWLVAEGTRSF